MIEAKSCACGPSVIDVMNIARPIVTVRLNVWFKMNILKLMFYWILIETRLSVVSLEVSGITRKRKLHTVQLPKVYAVKKFPDLISSVATPFEIYRWDISRIPMCHL